MSNDNKFTSYTFKAFIPLIIIFLVILLFTTAKQLIWGFNIKEAMYDFMAGFFIIFGAFKIYNLSAFAKAYSLYDIIAQRTILYAYLYPFIEIALGIAYLFRLQLTIVNWITLILMTINALGVAIELRRDRPIACACLGTVFKIPMTYVTLTEDILMGLMACMLLW